MLFLYSLFTYPTATCEPLKGATLKVGQEVEINQVKHRGQKFIITKINRTRCKIQAKDNRLESYNCPMSMLIA